MKRYCGILMLTLVLALGFTMPQTTRATDEPAYNIVFGRRDTVYSEGVSAMNIYMLDIASDQEQLLIESVGDRLILVSPDGERFMAREFAPDGDCEDTCIFDIGENSVQTIPPYVNYSTYVAWSPDGRQISFATWYAEVPGLYILDLETGAEQLIRDYRVYRNGKVAWSPDGGSIAVVWDDSYMHIYDVASGDMLRNRRVLIYGITSHPPAWSPSGTRLAVNGQGVFVLDADLNNIREVAPFRTTIESGVPVWFLGAPHWLPDESELIIGVFDTGVWQGYIISLDVNTSEMRVLAEGIEPSLSPDGEWIAFLGPNDSEADVYIMRVDGTDLRQLTDTDVAELHPEWVSRMDSQD